MFFKYIHISQFILFLMFSNFFTVTFAKSSDEKTRNPSRTFGGPDVVKNQIESDGTEVDSLFDIEFAKPYLEFKQ